MSPDITRRELLGYGVTGGVGVGLVALASAQLGQQSDGPTTGNGTETTAGGGNETTTASETTTESVDAPEISVEEVVRVGESRYEVTFGYAMPEDATVERSRFVSGNASNDPPQALEPGRHTFTVEWKLNGDNETLAWEVRLREGDDAFRAKTPTAAVVRDNWTLSLDQLQARFDQFAPTDITVVTDPGMKQTMRMANDRGKAAFTVRESGRVVYEENGTWWDVGASASEMMPPEMGGADGFGDGDENDQYTFTFSNSPYDGSQRMTHILNEGEHWGANVFYYFPEHDQGGAGLDSAQPDEVYSRIRVRFESDWVQRNDGDTCKIYWAGCNLSAGRAGSAGYAPSGDDGWSVRIYTRGPSDDGTVSLGSYVYHLDQNGNFGSLWDWSSEAEIGEWHQIDTYVRLNSVTDGSAERDGVVRMWLNGSLEDEHTDVRWRTTEDLGFDRLGPGSYWGGSEVSPRNNRVKYNDFQVNVGSEGL
ncbi:hypothetical protein [Halorussus amylolyticus]|uniref:hypothetical protein n=1 Tax=Halorussus amylolyticus TaxID=1126242 RepID=UPI0010510F21|nr:hypothetical protein [Halorussus amylolyticus]